MSSRRVAGGADGVRAALLSSKVLKRVREPGDVLRQSCFSRSPFYVGKG